MRSMGDLLSTPGAVLQGLIDDVHAPRLLPYVHPVYMVSDAGEPEALGSCVLLRRTRKLYVATAAHVLEMNESSPGFDPSSLYLGGRDGELFGLQAEFLANKEPADLAVAKLTGALAEGWDLYPALDLDSQVAMGGDERNAPPARVSAPCSIW